MFHKKSCFWNFRRNPQENTFAGVSFLAKLHTTGLICRASANYCFCKWISFLHNLLIKLFFLHVRFATSSRKTFSEKHLWLGSPRENRRNFVEVLKSPFKFKEAVAQTCSVKKVFLEISQNLQENTCARDSGTGVFPWILPNF